MTVKATTSKLNLAEAVAIGIGGMIGGGIFAVLGLAIAQAGHAVPLTLAIGGAIALLTGLSHAHLGLAFRGDGGSFTYIGHAFDRPGPAAVADWLLVAGYVGTLALYASAFGAYGTTLVDGSGTPGAISAGLAAQWPLAGAVATGLNFLLLMCRTYEVDPQGLWWIVSLYGVVGVIEGTLVLRRGSRARRP